MGSVTGIVDVFPYQLAIWLLLGFQYKSIEAKKGEFQETNITCRDGICLVRTENERGQVLIKPGLSFLVSSKQNHLPTLSPNGADSVAHFLWHQQLHFTVIWSPGLLTHFSLA